MATSLRESDLRPYQTHFIFTAPKRLDGKAVTALFDSLQELVDLGLDDPEQCKVRDRRAPRAFGDARIGWMVYSRSVAVTWASGPHAPVNVENHWLALVARNAYLSLVVTERTFASRVHRTAMQHPSWKPLSRVPAEALEAALIHGNARTMWLSGIHRSVATKADSKVLMGRDLEASLDVLGDQTYHYTSTRCEGPENAFTTATIGVTPRQSKVWLGPTSHWEAFIGNSARLLELIEAPKRTQVPYPILARPRASLAQVSEAFDVGLERADYVLDDASAQDNKFQELLQGVTWSVTAVGSGPNCEIDFKIGDVNHKVAIELNMDGDRVVHEAKLLASSQPELGKDIVKLCARADLLKIYFESAHTYSDGQMFQVKTRDIPFRARPEDFSGFDVTKEKPLPAGKTEGLDLKRIGEASDTSLFTWVFRQYRSGWLWCDDGSGEMADFLHLDNARKNLSFIHVKASHSSSPNRAISVSAYEVVCGQALKNLRYLERERLNESLAAKINADKIGRCWKDGKKQDVKSSAFQKALGSSRYSDLAHNVIVVQPHVRSSLLKKSAGASNHHARQASLLYTLLHGIDADVRRMGANFEVVVDR